LKQFAQIDHGGGRVVRMVTRDGIAVGGLGLAVPTLLHLKPAAIEHLLGSLTSSLLKECGRVREPLLNCRISDHFKDARSRCAVLRDLIDNLQVELFCPRHLIRSECCELGALLHDHPHVLPSVPLDPGPNLACAWTPSA
jgi:hypothetical protein